MKEEVVCQGCQFGKAYKLPFKSSNRERTIPFELIHTDLMGSTKTPSYSGCKYTMVLGDDYTRYTWLYFLKEKSEVTHKFVIFSDMVEKEFDAKIKCLRSDNGGEFNSTDFTVFCHEKKDPKTIYLLRYTAAKCSG